MNLKTVVRLAASLALVVSLPALAAAQAVPATEAPPVAAASSSAVPPSVKIAVINIDRVAAESEPGKKLLADLKAVNDRISEERSQLETEIRDMQTKMGSEILSQDARGRLEREIQRKQTDLRRWLEDKQAEFQEVQAKGEQKFQEELAPIVRQVAVEQGIGLILRETPGLTFVLDPTLDISPLVVQKLNEAAGAPNPPPEP